MNSLLRKSVPKGTGVQRVTDGKVKEVRGRRNGRPDAPRTQSCSAPEAPARRAGARRLNSSGAYSLNSGEFAA